MTTAESRTNFAAKLTTLTTAQGLVLRALAKAARMSHGLLCDIMAARKSAGPDISVKLADALHLEGEPREEFLIAAATRVHDRLLQLSQDVVPGIVNFPAAGPHRGRHPAAVRSRVHPGRQHAHGDARRWQHVHLHNDHYARGR